MPEGDTVHKVARALEHDLTGAVVRRVTVEGRPIPGLAGRRVSGIFAKGKHLFIRLEGDAEMRSHLGLYGAWHRYAPAEPWRKPEARASLALWTGHAVFVCFNAREVELLREAGIGERKVMERLGPDLGAPKPDLEIAVRRARELIEAEVPMVDVLLNQRAACGIGNVYKCEVLFLEGVHPRATLGAVADGVLHRLYGTAHRLIRVNLGGAPRATRAGSGPRLWVYGRGARPCLRCGTPIRYGRLGRSQRASYWCPHCQPLPTDVPKLEG